MGDKSDNQLRTHGALVALCVVMITAAAAAQNTSIERIEAIERQIRGLQGELQQLKSELGEAKQQLRQSRSEAQRSKEELRQAREAAAQAQQDAQRAAIAESRATASRRPGEGSRCRSSARRSVRGGQVKYARRATNDRHRRRPRFAGDWHPGPVRHGHLFPEPETEHAVPT